MSELENIKPVAFYRADWKGDMMFRKDNTVVIRKNEGDFTTGWIKPLYDELPEPQPQLTIPQSIADKLDKDDANNKTVLDWVFATEMIVINDEKELKRREDEILRRRAIVSIYGASKALGVDLVKVVEG